MTTDRPDTEAAGPASTPTDAARLLAIALGTAQPDADPVPEEH